MLFPSNLISYVSITCASIDLTSAVAKNLDDDQKLELCYIVAGEHGRILTFQGNYV